MQRPKTNNITAWVTGINLNVFQKADAVIEYNKLLDYVDKLEKAINYTLCSTELLDFEQWREKQITLPDTAEGTLEEYFKWKAIT